MATTGVFAPGRGRRQGASAGAGSLQSSGEAELILSTGPR